MHAAAGVEEALVEILSGSGSSTQDSTSAELKPLLNPLLGGKILRPALPPRAAQHKPGPKRGVSFADLRMGKPSSGDGSTGEGKWDGLERLRRVSDGNRDVSGELEHLVIQRLGSKQLLGPSQQVAYQLHTQQAQRVEQAEVAQQRRGSVERTWQRSTRVEQAEVAQQSSACVPGALVQPQQQGVSQLQPKDGQLPIAAPSAAAAAVAPASAPPPPSSWSQADVPPGALSAAEHKGLPSAPPNPGPR